MLFLNIAEHRDRVRDAMFETVVRESYSEKVIPEQEK